MTLQTQEFYIYVYPYICLRSLGIYFINFSTDDLLGQPSTTFLSLYVFYIFVIILTMGCHST